MTHFVVARFQHETNTFAATPTPPIHDRSDMLLRASRYLLPEHSSAPRRIRRWRRKADQNPMTP